MNRSIVSHIIRLVLYLLLQVLLMRHVVLFDLSFNFIYVVGLLLLPIELASLTAIAIGFFSGLFVDIFYNTQGIQAASAVLVMFLRPFWFSRVTGGFYEPGTTLNIREMGNTWFLVFCVPLILVHHLTIFFVEAGSGNLFFYTLSKAFLSTIFTFIVAVFIQYFFTKPRRRV